MFVGRKHELEGMNKSTHIWPLAINRHPRSTGRHRQVPSWQQVVPDFMRLQHVVHGEASPRLQEPVVRTQDGAVQAICFIDLYQE